MRKLLPILVVLLPFIADPAAAQGNFVTISCDSCRHPHQHPEDYVNHAFNQIYGPEAWMSFEQADDFAIVNSRGLRVYVDVDFQFLSIGIEGLRLPFWPKNLLEITLALPNGEIHRAVRSVFQAPLPVPANAYDNADHGLELEPGAADHGDDGIDDYDFEIEEIEEPEYDGPVGITGIEDPDENGEFGNIEWCEEC
jgi:hypothetical protein